MDDLKRPQLMGLLAVLLGFFASLGVVTTASAADPGTISGTVAGGVSGWVSFQSYAQYESVATSNGEFVSPVLPAGEYMVSFSSSSADYAYTTYYPGTTVSADATKVVLSEGQFVENVDFAPVGATTISGKVILPAGGSSYMSLRNLEGLRVDSTGISPDGSYQFDRVVDGSYLVVAERSQTVQRTFYAGTIVEGDAVVVAVVNSQPVTLLDFAARAGGTITGTVTAPVDEVVSVQVYDEAGVLVGQTWVDVIVGTGTYSLGGLAGGTYYVAFQRSSTTTQFAAEFYDDVPDGSGIGYAADLAVADGGTTGDVNAALVLGGTATGTVLDDQGLPLAGAGVAAFTPDDSLTTRNARTDAAGNFTITGLSTGAYNIGVTSRLGPLFYGDVRDLADSSVVAMTIGTDVDLGTISYAVPTFSDVPATWPFFSEVEWLRAQGITTGYPDGTFRPLLPINRDAMAAFLYRFAGSPAYAPPATSPFADMTSETMFYKEVAWLAERGITTGWTEDDGSKTFRPWQPINRDAMAAFLYRFADSPAFTPPDPSPLADMTTTTSFYPEVTWLAEQGITTGWTEDDGTKTYRPLQPINRDAMAAFLYRYFSILGAPSEG